MAFVACIEKLFQGHVDAFPPGAPGFKAFDRGPAARASLDLGRHQVSNRFAMTGDCYGFPMLNLTEQLGKVSFCFGCLDFTHIYDYTG